MAAIVINIAGSYDDKAIAQAQKRLSDLDGSAAAASAGMAGAFTRAGDTLKKVGANVSAAGMTMVKGVTLPIVGVGIAAAVAFDKVDEGLDTVAAKSGFTGEKLKGLEVTFKNVAANATQGMDEIGESVGLLAGKLNLTGAPLEKLSTQVLDFARVTKTDAATAADTVATAMQAFGLSASEAGPLLDSLVAASQRSGVSVSELGSQLATVAPQFQTYGLSVEESIGLLTAFGKSGIPATKMATGLNTAFKNLREQGVKDLPQGLRDVFEQIKNAENPTKATRIAVETFGSRVGITLAEAIQSGKVSLADLDKGLKGTKGALDQAVKATDGPQEAFARLKNQATLLGAGLAELALPVVQMLVPAVQKVIDYFRSLSPETQRIIVIIAAVAAAVGPLLVVLGSLISAIGALSGAIGFLIANPIVPAIIAIVAAIAALVVGIKYAYENFDGFRNFVDSVWRGIQAAVAYVVDWFQTYVWPILQEVFGYIKIGLSVLWDAYKVYWTFIWELVQKIAAWFMEYVWPTLDKVFQLIGQALPVLWNAYKTYWTLIANGVRVVVDWFMTYVWPTLSRVFDMIGTALGVLWNAYKTYWTFIWDVVKAVINWITDTGWPFIRDAFNNMKRGAEILWNGIQTAFNLIRSHVQTVITTVVSILRGIGSIVSTVIGFFESIRQGIVERLTAALEFVTSIPGKIVSALGNLGTLLYQTGVDIIQGLINGIRNAAGGILSTITSTITDKIPQWVKDRLGISSPSKVMMEIGQWIPAGLAKGIENRSRDVAEATRKLIAATTKEARKAAREALKEAEEEAKDLAKRIRERIRESAEAGLETIKDKAREVISYVEGVIDRMGDFGKLAGFDLGAIDEARRALVSAEEEIAQAVAERKKAQDALNKALAAGDDDKAASARDALAQATERLQQAEQSAANARRRVSETAPTARNIVEDMRNRLRAAIQFAGVVQNLSALGLNNASLQEIISMGPGAGTTFGEGLLQGGSDYIAQVNALQSALRTIGMSVGDVGARSQYGMGYASAQGVMGTNVTVQNGAVVINFGAGVEGQDRAAIEKAIAEAVAAGLAALAREIQAS